MNETVVLIHAARGDPAGLETHVFPHRDAPDAAAGLVLPPEIVEHAVGLAAALAIGPRVLVITLETSGPEEAPFSWLAAFKEVVAEVARSGDSSGSFLEFVPRPDSLSAGYLVPMARLPESIIDYLKFNKVYNKKIMMKIERDLREAIEGGFPVVSPEIGDFHRQVHRLRERRAMAQMRTIEDLQGFLDSYAGKRFADINQNIQLAQTANQLAAEAGCGLRYDGQAVKVYCTRNNPRSKYGDFIIKAERGGGRLKSQASFPSLEAAPLGSVSQASTAP